MPSAALTSCGGGGAGGGLGPDFGADSPAPLSFQVCLRTWVWLWTPQGASGVWPSEHSSVRLPAENQLRVHFAPNLVLEPREGAGLVSLGLISEDRIAPDASRSPSPRRRRPMHLRTDPPGGAHTGAKHRGSGSGSGTREVSRDLVIKSQSSKHMSLRGTLH